MSNKTLDLQKEAGPIGNTKEMDSEEEAKTVILTDDDESSTNSDESSDDEDYIPCMSWEDRKKKNLKLSNFEGFEESDKDDDVTQKMKSMLALRASLGMDDDKVFMAEQEKKAKEKKMLAAMTCEERMKYKEHKANDVMSKIRERHNEKRKQKQLDEMSSKEYDDGALGEQEWLSNELKKKKKKKNRKSSKGTTTVVTSNPGEIPENEVVEENRKKKKQPFEDENRCSSDEKRKKKEKKKKSSGNKNGPSSREITKKKKKRIKKSELHPP